MEDFTQLIKKLKKLKEPNNEIDKQISALFSNDQSIEILPYTGSIEVCLNLIKKYLPDFKWIITNIGYNNGIYQNGKMGCYFYSPFSSGPVTKQGFGYTIPSTILLTFFNLISDKLYHINLK